MDKSLKDLFDKRAWAWQVRNLSTEQSLEYENGIRSKYKNYTYGRRGILFATGIYSERTAHLLNYIFNYKRWTSGIWDFHQGGGFIVDCGTTVRIGKFDEICFDLSIKCIDLGYCESLCVVKPKIYKMVKAAIKDYMRIAFTKEKIKVKKVIDDNGFIIKNVSIDELKVLIDYFNWKDVRNSYSPELIDKVFGKKTENQFAISASEVIENQIKELIEERKSKVDENSERFSKVRDWIMKKWRDSEAKLKDEYDAKINELEYQIKEMSANF